MKKQKRNNCCRVQTCDNCGDLCFRHCGRCFEPVKWRPSLLDKEIKYNGPKPLNLDDTVHYCYFEGEHADHNCIYNVPEYIKNHYRSLIKNGKCRIKNCFCIAIEAMKDQKVLAENNKKRAEWLKKWESLDEPEETEWP